MARAANLSPYSVVFLLSLVGCGAPDDAEDVSLTAAGGSGGVSAGGSGGMAQSGGSSSGGSGAGTGGSTGATGGTSTGGAGETGGSGGTLEPTDCNPIFEGVCTPDIVFSNEEAAGDGAMFDQLIGDPVATMQQITCQVCSILYRDPSEVQKKPDTIHLTITDFDGVAYAGGGDITFSSRHIKNYANDPEEALFEYLGVLYHETAHLYQWDDGGGGLVEGMADFVRIRAGHHHLNRRGPGGAWTDAYTTSGFFFSWLAGSGLAHDDGRNPSDPDIGWAINQQMKDQWNQQVFVDRFGVDVDTLWAEYQAAIQ